MMKSKTLLSAALLLSLIASTAASCGGTADAPDTNNTPNAPVTAGATEAVTEAETEPALITPNLPDTDWGGEEFVVLVRESPNYTSFNNFEVFSEGETGEPVNDAVFRRNVRLEDMYNVKISEVRGFDDPGAALKKTVTAGEDVYDVAFLTVDTIATSAQNGYFYDLNTVKYIDFSQPWWYPEVNKCVSFFDKIFFTTSNYSMVDKSRTWVMYYNPDIAQQYDIPDFAQTVRDGKWTVDLMNSYVRMVANDVNGDGKMDSNDTYGLVMGSYNAFATFVMAMDNRVVTKIDKDSLTLTMNNQHMVDSIDKTIALTCDINTAFFCNDYKGKTDGDYWAAASDAFKEGRALFVGMIIGSFKSYSAGCEFNFGCLPFPKYDESQEKYLTIADPYALMFGIPASSQTPDFSGFMLEALSATSTDTVLKTYIETCCKTKYSYRPENAEMLDIVIGGTVYDPGFFYKVGDLSEIILNKIPGVKENTFASLYAKQESKAIKAIEKLEDKISNLQ